MIRDQELRPTVVILFSALAGWLWPFPGLTEFVSAMVYSGLLVLTADTLIRATQEGFDLDSVTMNLIGAAVIVALTVPTLPGPAVAAIAMAAALVLLLLAELMARISRVRRRRSAPAEQATAETAS